MGCGGVEPDKTVETILPPAPATMGQQTADEQAATEQASTQTELVREVFSYRGSGRDPFVSLLQSGGVRPLVQDLRVTSVMYNARYPATSVAVLRDTVVNQAYTVRVGDELGRMRVAEIRPYYDEEGGFLGIEVVLIVQEFGAERPVVLRQRRRQEGTP